MLKFPTVPALRAALRRKRIALIPLEMPGRKQHVFATEDVARCVESCKRRSTVAESHAGGHGKEDTV